MEMYLFHRAAVGFCLGVRDRIVDLSCIVAHLLRQIQPADQLRNMQGIRMVMMSRMSGMIMSVMISMHFLMAMPVMAGVRFGMLMSIVVCVQFGMFMSVVVCVRPGMLSSRFTFFLPVHSHFHMRAGYAACAACSYGV